MQRVKNIDYDEDDLYDEEEEQFEEDGYTDEDRNNFATLTPVVRAELDEAGLQASDREIEEALWHYYWDVGKSVAYLKNTRTPRTDTPKKGKGKGEQKAKSKFDQAAEQSAAAAGELRLSFGCACEEDGSKIQDSIIARRGQNSGLLSSRSDWFAGVPWSNIPLEMQGHIVPTYPIVPQPKLLGGSSKLAKLAEERRKKAATASSPAPAPNGALSSLDRLSKPKDANENVKPQPKSEPKKYPIRKKSEPAPPPKEPTPPPKDPADDLPDLRASPTDFGRTLSSSPPQNAAADVALKDLLGSVVKEDPFKGPSPDDTVLHSSKSKSSTNGLAKKTEALKLDSSTPAPATPTPQVRVKSKGLDVPKLWAEEKSKWKPSAAFVVIGHVDHGKSTLMGRLLLDTGAVSQRDIDKYKKQATELGKASFALAWVMDTGSEERERGVTVDIAQHHFTTDKADFTILDAPGHRDFVPNMIGGASMADLAVLVVDANQLDSGMKGQTREHILLAKACGLKKIIVAVNKLDSSTPSWDEKLFKNVKAEISKFLISAGFATEDLAFVPCSGLNGQNVVTPPSAKGDTTWVAKNSSTLLQELERSASSNVADEAILKASLRMQITDVFRGSLTNPLSVAGRITAGNVQIGDTILVQPSGETAVVKAIEANNEAKGFAVASQITTLHLTDIDAQHLRTGDVLCSPNKPVSVVKNTIAQVVALDSLLPQGADLHIGRLNVPGSIAALITTVDAKGEVLKKKPRVIKAGQRANIKLVLDEGAPLSVGDRIVLRSNGSTIAAGKIERVGS